MIEERRDAAEGQGQMEDQETFGEDPRGRKKESGQSGETQPARGGSRDDADDTPDADDERGQRGRDDPGQATGNPLNAG